MQTKKVFATGCKKIGYMVSFVMEVRGKPRPLMRDQNLFGRITMKLLKKVISSLKRQQIGKSLVLYLSGASRKFHCAPGTLWEEYYEKDTNCHQLVALMGTTAAAQEIGATFSRFDDNWLTVLRTGMVEYAGQLMV